ncbi:MAG TPA: hypothetical protein VM597_38300 [Gemmataceae bacterium]|jgi:hypothetical protein|nr:hypothetical protein [Gemmataceae bacterium]
MSRSVSLMVVCAVFFDGVTAFADEDVVEKQLLAAKLEFESAAEKARTGLLADLKKKEEAAQKAGDLKTLEKVQAEAKAFEADGTLPKAVAVKGYESQLRTARAKLEEEYAAAVKQYTKGGKIALAKAVQQELDEFKKGGVPLTKAPPVATFKKGTLWEGPSGGGAGKTAVQSIEITELDSKTGAFFGKLHMADKRPPYEIVGKLMGNTFAFETTKRKGDNFHRSFTSGKIDGNKLTADWSGIDRFNPNKRNSGKIELNLKK